MPDTPEFFVNWLRTLTAEQADQMWLYLDGYSQDEAIEIVAKIATAGGYGWSEEDNSPTTQDKI